MDTIDISDSTNITDIIIELTAGPLLLSRACSLTLSFSAKAQSQDWFVTNSRVWLYAVANCMELPPKQNFFAIFETVFKTLYSKIWYRSGCDVKYLLFYNSLVNVTRRNYNFALYSCRPSYDVHIMQKTWCPTTLIYTTYSPHELYQRIPTWSEKERRHVVFKCRKSSIKKEV